jgi:hypothetical protein
MAQLEFRWNLFYKVWWKVVKQMDLAAEEAAAAFDISIAPPEILIERLWYD